MDYIRMIMSYGLMVGLLAAVLIGMSMTPRCSHAVAPPDYYDMLDIPKYSDVSYDGTVKIHQYTTGDKVVIDLGDSHSTGKLFGWVAGVPGDVIGVAEGHITVNGVPLRTTVSAQRIQNGDIVTLSNGLSETPGIVVPADHLYVVSDRHTHDSTVFGPVPATAILGKITHITPHLE